MKRVILCLTAAALTVAMLAVMAAPGFAQDGTSGVQLLPDQACQAAPHSEQIVDVPGGEVSDEYTLLPFGCVVAP